jgi:hypothetical protein
MLANRAERRALAKEQSKTDPFEFKSAGAKVIADANTKDFSRAWGRCFDILVSCDYLVLVFGRDTEWGEVTHLAIRRADESTDISWSAKQAIKDRVVGPSRTAVEVFPAASELVNQANMYHLWVLPSGMSLPFSIKRRV